MSIYARSGRLGHVAPLFVTALSIPVLREPVGVRRWAAVGVGFLGVLVIVRPVGAGFLWVMFLPVLTALCWSMVLVVTRLMRLSERPLTVLPTNVRAFLLECGGMAGERTLCLDVVAHAGRHGLALVDRDRAGLCARAVPHHPGLHARVALAAQGPDRVSREKQARMICAPSSNAARGGRLQDGRYLPRARGRCFERRTAQMAREVPRPAEPRAAWSGLGRTPQWVQAIIDERGIDRAAFKSIPMYGSTPRAESTSAREIVAAGGGLRPCRKGEPRAR